MDKEKTQSFSPRRPPPPVPITRHPSQPEGKPAQEYLTNDAVRSGFMNIMDISRFVFGSRWVRWFVILTKDDMIHIFDKETSKRPHESVDLTGYKDVECFAVKSKGAPPWGVTLVPGNSCLPTKTFSCISEGDRKQWMNSLRQGILQANSHNLPGFSDLPPDIEDPTPAPDPYDMIDEINILCPESQNSPIFSTGYTLERMCDMFDCSTSIVDLHKGLKKKPPGTYLIRSSRDGSSQVIAYHTGDGNVDEYKMFKTFRENKLTIDPARRLSFVSTEELLREYTLRTPLHGTEFYLKRGFFFDDLDNMPEPLEVENPYSE